MIKSQVIADFKKVLEKLGISGIEPCFEHPVQENHGDYSTNIALKTKTPKPVDLADKIVNIWQNIGLPDWLAEVKTVPPGFINLRLKIETLKQEAKKILKEKEKYGSSDWGKGKTVVVDYSSPNIAKQFGIGHLRSTIIGQAIYNIYKFGDWRTIGDNHLGDWGTQFGKLIVAIKKWGLEKKEFNIGELEEFYVKFHQEAEKEPKLDEEARFWFKKLEEGEREARGIWKKSVEISLLEFNRIYDLLGIRIDFAFPESFYEDKIKEVLEEAKRKGVARESKGALVIPFDELGIPPGMLLKSDGGTTYFTRDLATILFRKEKWNPDLYIYEVGADQKLHLKQVFKAAERLGYGKFSQFVHLAHGLIRFPYGKMSTRSGQTIHLEKVLNEAVERAKKIIKKSGTSRGLMVEEEKKAAVSIGIGAVKYFDLAHHPTTDIIFDWKKIFVLEGNSGPYLQYTYARCRSVIKKSGAEVPSEIPKTEELTDEETAVLRTIYRFPEAVEDAARTFSPNLICNFLFNLAQKYNLFYQTRPILKAGKKEQRGFRLILTAATAQILQNGLNLLGIEVLERM